MLYLIIFITAILQATLFNAIAIANIKPDLLLALVIFAGLDKGCLQGAAAGIIAGFLADLLSTGPFVNTFVLAACGFSSGLFIEKFYFFKENIFVWFTVVFCASSISAIVNLAIIGSALYTGIPAVLYTCLASVGLLCGLKHCLL